MKYMFIFLCSINFCVPAFPVDGIIKNGQIHEVKARSGDGIDAILARYELAQTNDLKQAFLALNNLTMKSALFKHKKYKLPVYLYKYNGKSIRSTIGINDWDKAVRIQEYNELLLKKGVRSTHYSKSKILWVPFSEMDTEPENRIDDVKPITSSPKDDPSKAIKLNPRLIKDDMYGHKYADVNIIDNHLKGKVFYVVSGHGGPDPGAICTECTAKLCEDEYAYDVSLRLARNLRQHGAKVEMVIQDRYDGIRDKQILSCDSNERLADGSKIPAKHLARLQQRTNYINKKYKTYKSQGYHEQSVISLHIDSNSKSHKQDVFFCYYKGSNSSRQLAVELRDKFEEKYNQHQKNRGYKGYLHQRNLYVLRKTAPRAVLIELANIKNKHNHKRILQKDNRQALANWIYEGLAGKEPGKEERLLASK